MKTRRLVEALLLSVFLTGCNEDGFYEKTYLDAAGKVPTDIANDDSNNGSNQEGDDSSNNPGQSDNNGNNDNNGGGNNTGDTGNGGNTGSGSGSNNGGGIGSGGQNCQAPQHGQSFTQNSAQSSKLDILWVIDDSGSMGDEQASLAYNFDAFIQEFITKGTDFRMAITTTDTSSNYRDGRLHGRILTSADLASNEQAFLADFADYVQVGTNGAGDEKGLRASKSFLNKNGASFLRSDAYLVVVYLSDEQDDSENSVASYVNALRAHKASSGLVKAYSIVNTANTQNSWEEIGTRYIQATEELGGQVSNIKQDFYTTLSQMGEQLVDLTDSFALNSAATAGSIRVSVNGVVVNSGWSYNADTYSVKFDSQSVPSQGAHVRIEYLGLCQ